MSSTEAIETETVVAVVLGRVDIPAIVQPSHSFEKGSGTNNAKHPKGRSGYWYLTPFRQSQANPPS